MTERRIFQKEVTGNAQFTVRETRTVTTSVRTVDSKEKVDEPSGNWQTVTSRETHTSDGIRRGIFNQTNNDQVSFQRQFGDLSIREKTKKFELPAEETPKKGFFSAFTKPKRDQSASSAPVTVKSTQCGANFEKRCLETHNSYRAKHGVPPLTLSKELCRYASEWASKLAKEDKFQHRSNNKYGENIYMKWSSDPNYDIDGKDPVDDWYAEIKDHKFGREPTSLNSGHFTQVVWEESRELGVGKGKSKSGKIIVVANYDPPGNMMGDFARNVHPPSKIK